MLFSVFSQSLEADYILLLFLCRKNLIMFGFNCYYLAE